MGSLTIRKSRGTPGVVIRSKAKLKEIPKPKPEEEPVIIVGGSDDEEFVPFPPGICYVCEKRIKADQEAVRGVGIERHTFCGPGTKNWLESKYGKRSKYRELFLNNPTNEKKKKEEGNDIKPDDEDE